MDLLEQVGEQDLQTLGYAFSIWTRERLCLHLKAKTSILIKPTSFARYEREPFCLSASEAPLDQPARRRLSSAEEWLKELKKRRAGEADCYTRQRRWRHLPHWKIAYCPSF